MVSEMILEVCNRYSNFKWQEGVGNFIGLMKYVIINSHCVLLDERNDRRKMGLARYVESRERNLF